MKILDTDRAGLTAYLRLPTEHRQRIRHSNFIGILSRHDDHAFDLVFCVADTVIDGCQEPGLIAREVCCRSGVSRAPRRCVRSRPVAARQAVSARGSLQTSARKVPITVRLTPEQEAAYALGYGLSRAGLKPEVQAEYDRLLAEGRAGRSGQAVEFRFSFLSMGEPFTILASSGQVGYEVRTVADVAEHLSVRAVGGAAVAAVVRDPRTSGFRVLANGEEVALVRARGRFRRRYLIAGAGEQLNVTGHVYRGRYELRAGDANGLTRVQVLRKEVVRLLSTRTNVRAVIASGEGHLRCLAIVLGIEYLAEDRRQTFNELGLRRIWFW